MLEAHNELTITDEYIICGEGSTRYRKNLCLCSCGKERYVRKSYVRNGRIKSCGHHIKTRQLKPGDIWGCWKLIKNVGSFDGRGGTMWFCECTTCGENWHVLAGNIITGASKRCINCRDELLRTKSA